MEALEPVGRLGVPVDAPEHERRVAEVEVGQPLDQGLVERIALEPGLERAAEIGLGQSRIRHAAVTTGVRDSRTRDRCMPALRGDPGAAGSYLDACNAIGESSRQLASRARDGCDRPRPLRSSPPRAGRPAAVHAGLVHAAGGRSLPEYRAIRGEGSILDAIKRPELAAEITLQPVRRYGVDAAVLFSDIVVPAHAVGFGIDVAPGTGPVADRPLRTRADLDRLRPLDRSTTSTTWSTPCALLAAELPADVPLLAFAGAPFTVASYLIEGRPSRDYRAHQGADPHRRGAVARDHGAARRLGDHVHRRPAEPTARARSSCSTRGPVRSAAPTTTGSCSRTPAACSTSSADRHPDAPASTSASAATTCSSRCTPPGRRVLGLDWRTPITDARGAAGRRPRRPGQPRSGARARRRRRGARRGRATCSPTTPAPPATSSTSATASRPTPIPACCRPSSTSSTSSTATSTRGGGVSAPVAVVLMAYGTPGDPSEIEAYYTDIRRGRPPTPEAARRPHRPVRGDRWRVAARRASPRPSVTRCSASLDEREPGRFVVSLGMKHADPKVEVGRRRRRRAGSETIVGLVLAPHYSVVLDRRVPRPAARPAPAGPCR